MKVYHGTSMRHWQRIKEEGLLPRQHSGSTNWEHSIESNPHTVYVSSSYAPYFALNALNLGNEDNKDFEGNAVVIEIDTDLLDPRNLVPDEDALEQFSRTLKGPYSDQLPPQWGMIERTRYYRGQVQAFAGRGLGFNWSLEVLGTAGHIGPILPSSFTRAAVFNIREEREYSFMYMDCQVSVGNYKYLGKRYEAMTRYLFGEKPEFKGDDVFAILPVPPLSANVKIINLKE